MTFILKLCDDVIRVECRWSTTDEGIRDQSLPNCRVQLKFETPHGPLRIPSSGMKVRRGNVLIL